MIDKKLTFLKKGDNLYARHICRTRECLYTRRQLENLANYKEEQGNWMISHPRSPRDIGVGKDMLDNVKTIRDLLAKE